MKPHITSSGISHEDINQSTLLIDIATRNVVRLAPADSVGEAAQLMAGKRISSIVVTDAEGYPVGIVTERNMLHAMQSGCLPGTALREIMSAPVITMPESITCLDAYQVCLRDGIRHLVIVDDDRRLLGVVSETDFRLHINLATLAGHRQIASVMSRSVFSLPPEASLQEALNLMHLHRDTCVVVADDEGPLGIVTERDIVRLYSGNLDRTGIPLRDVMTSPVLTIPQDHTINEAAGIMLKSRVRHLVVVDHAGRVAGLVSEHGLTHTMTMGLIDSKLNAEGAFLHTLVSTIPDMIWLKDVNGVYMACNPRFERFFGAKEKDIVGKTDYDFVGKELADFFREHDRAAMEKDRPSVNEEWVTFADDGHRELLETIKTPMHDGTGRLIGVLGIARDITGRMQAEEELRKLSAAVEQSAASVMITDLEARIQYVNPHFTESTGYSAAEVIGQNPRILQSGQTSKETYRELWGTLTSGQKWNGELLNKRKNGEFYWEDVSIAPIKDTRGVATHYVAVKTEITERKKMESALAESEHRYRTLIENSPFCIHEIDLQGRLQSMNHAGLDMLGLDDEKKICGVPYLSAVSEQDGSYVKALMQDAFNGTASHFEFAASGDTPLYFKSCFIPIRDAGGKVMKLMGLTEDITKRKCMEQQLAEREKLFRAVFEQASSAVELVDADSLRFIEINPSACRMLGYTHEEYLRLRLTDTQAELDEAALIVLIRQLEASGGATFESRHRCKNGDILDVEISARMLDLPGRRMLVGVWRDITEKKRAEKTLRENEAKYRQLFEAAGDGIFIQDAHGFTDCNDKGASMYGLTRAEVISRHPAELAPERQPDGRLSADFAGEQIAAALEGKSRQFEWQALRADGTTLDVEITLGRIELNGSVRLQAVVRDISSRKQAEEMLRKQKQFSDDVINSLPGIFYMLNQQGNFVRVNPRFLEVSGYSQDEIAGMHALDFFGVADRNVIEKRIGEVFEAGESWAEAEFITKSGQNIPYYFSGRRTEIDGEHYLVGLGADIAERKRTEVELRRLSEAIRQCSEAIVLADTSLHFQYVNPAFEKLFGYSLGELQGRDLSLLLPDVPAKQAANHIENASFEGEKLRRAKDGHNIPILLKVAPFRSEDGEVVGFIGAMTDITERKRAEENLRITASVFDNSQEAIVITDADNIITDVNKAFTNITGYSREEALGRNPSLLSSGRQSKAFYAEMWQSLEQKKSWRGEIWNRRKSGDIYAELLSISVIIGDDGIVQRYVGIFSDISYLKEHEAELSRVAHYDALTGIPNRVLLADRMRQAIAQTSRERNMMAVCYLDLDSFKPINDTLGHDAGDLVLVEISRRIGKTIRGGDTVARLGGDEFVVLLLGLDRGEECVVTLERLLAAIAQPIIIKDRPQTLGASIGVSIYPLDDEDPDTLLRHADQAMYVAKQSGKNRFYIYDPTLDQRARSHREFIDSIGHALENNQFELYYQPKINLRTKRMVGVEALIRWHHPKRGLLSPAEFLRPIEMTELDIATGDWVIATALAQINRWRQTGLDIEVSINISAHHLESPRFAEKLRQHLAHYPGMQPGRLQIEVLETAALNDIVIVREVIEACRKFGVGFALDDFGTGYSSLSYLSSLPVDVLKIDQSFVRDMLEDKGDMAIVQGIIALAQAFDLQTVAEGIETGESYRALLDMGCEVGQGYHIAYPMTADALTNWHPG